VRNLWRAHAFLSQVEPSTVALQYAHEGSRDPASGALQITRSGGVLVLNDTQLASSPRKVPHETQLKPFLPSTKPYFGFGFERYFSADDQWATGACRAGAQQSLGAKKVAAMKRCAQCHGKLGLGVRSRILWNGRWWIHVRYCSTHCEALHGLERRQRQTSLAHTFPSRSSPQS
jgi:hypothetical protein